MDASDRELIASALRFALEAHGDQPRKGTRIPYVSHVIAVAALVLEHGGDAEQTAAALLHDTIEDCGVSEAQIRERFGGEVARIVKSLSDVLEGDTPERKSPWAERKTRYLAHLAEVDDRTRLVAGCDKLHNLRSLTDDLAAEGKGTLARFSGSPRQIRWYYEEVERAIGASLPERLRSELALLVGELSHWVSEASPRT